MDYGGKPVGIFDHIFTNILISGMLNPEAMITNELKPTWKCKYCGHIYYFETAYCKRGCGAQRPFKLTGGNRNG